MTTTWTLAGHYLSDDLPKPFGCYDYDRPASLPRNPVAVLWLNLTTGAMIAAISDTSNYDGGGGCKYRINYAPPGAQDVRQTIELTDWPAVGWNPRQTSAPGIDSSEDACNRVTNEVTRRLMSGDITDRVSYLVK